MNIGIDGGKVALSHYLLGWNARGAQAEVFSSDLRKICTTHYTDFVLSTKKEVNSMELRELVLEVEELEEKIAPASGSIGGH